LIEAFRVQGLEVQRFRVLRFRVQGSGFGVWVSASQLSARVQTDRRRNFEKANHTRRINIEYPPAMQGAFDVLND